MAEDKMTDRAPDDRCTQCNGCIQCQEEHCIFNAHGDTHECRSVQCIYCVRFMRRDRLFLNNVG